MASVTDICNMALTSVRAGQINDFTAESSQQAVLCRLWYPQVVEMVQRQGTWQFCRGIRTLAPISTEIFNWSFAYAYPTDTLRIDRLINPFEELPAGTPDYLAALRREQVFPLANPRPQVPYEVFFLEGQKVIGANLPQLRIDYVFRQDDPTQWSAEFRIAVSYLLAASIVIPIVGVKDGRALREESLQLYRSYIASASVNDSNDKYLEPHESEFVTIRN